MRMIVNKYITHCKTFGQDVIGKILLGIVTLRYNLLILILFNCTECPILHLIIL